MAKRKESHLRWWTRIGRHHFEVHLIYFANLNLLVCRMKLPGLFFLLNVQLTFSEANFGNGMYYKLLISEGYFATLSKTVVQMNSESKCGMLAAQMNKSVSCYEEEICTLSETEGHPFESLYGLNKRCFSKLRPSNRSKKIILSYLLLAKVNWSNIL